MKKTKQLFLALALVLTAVSFSQVGIGTTTPNPSSVLDLSSTTRGLLLPRLTTTERDAITSPATGLVLYNTTVNQMQSNTGTPAAPIWTSASDTDTNIYTNNGTVSGARTVTHANNITFTGAGNLLKNLGKIGVNTTNPATSIEVASVPAGDGIRVRGSDGSGGTTGGFVQLSTFGTLNSGQIEFYKTDGATRIGYIGYDTTNMSYNVENGGMHFFQGGNMGISTNSTPLSRLHVRRGGDGEVGRNITPSAPVFTIERNGTTTNISPLDKQDLIATFDLGSFEAVSGAKTQLDIKLRDVLTSKNVDMTVMSLRSNGNVGIGTTTPASTLEVNGTATNTAATSVSSATIDFALSNLAVTSNASAAITLTNLKNGGAYTLVITGSAADTVAFTAAGFTFKYLGTSARIAAKNHIYSIIVAGTVGYVTMASEN